MKGISGGLNRDVGPSSTPKSEVQRWKPSVGGWTSGLSSTPKKLCSEMKGISGRLNRDVGPSSTPKSRVQRWKPSVGGWTSGLSSTPKSCVQRWKVSVAGWTGMWVPVQPRKVKFRDESHQWGVEPWVWVQPEKSCSEMKGISGGLNRDVGPSSTPKSGVQRWKPSVGGWTSGLSSTPKKLCSEMKGISGGLNRDVGPSPAPERGKKTLLVRLVLRHRFNS